MTTYVEVARSLPLPGPEQTRAFANYLTDAHSWYKIQRRDGFAFTFFLDPNAGRTKFLSHDGARFEDKTGVAVRPGQTTASYHEHFGHWNYWHSLSEAPKVLAADGTLLEIPADLIRAGTARVSRLIYGRKRPPAAERELDTEDEMRFGGIFTALPSPGYTLTPQSAMGLESDLPGLPGPLADALRPLVALWGEESYRREWSEIGRPLAEVHEKVYAEKGYFDDRMKKLGGDRISEETRAAWERSGSRRREKELLRNVIIALDAERERQVAGMVKAMVAFLAALSKS